VTLEQAVELLRLPRLVAVAEDGEEVWARNGRYGPYVQKGKESRSLESEEQLLTIDLDEALARLAQPKQRRGARQAAEPLNQLGPDPEGRPVVVKPGRFGPYVTDGETNASLRSGDDPEGITLERALELLAERRAKGPAKKAPKARSRGRRKAS
jgi:DNA topoisomerase-1